LLAGRKLLLADDSVTIQKVIDLTFADEGVTVVAFGNGREAIDRIEEIAPDVVLADVFMPEMNGYEVCKYIKENEKLKHIPVMLLVGSFEPFDEAEARRVGADDILTKPFQSIRRLIDRVGSLVSKGPAEDQMQTAEFPALSETPVENPAAEEQSAEVVERLNTQELETTTADTLPLPQGVQPTPARIAQESSATHPTLDNQEMDTSVTELRGAAQAEPSDTLLDLGDFEPAHTVEDDDFVLELDLDGPLYSGSDQVVSESTFEPAFVEPQVSEVAAAVVSEGLEYHPEVQHDVSAPYAAKEDVAYEDQVHEVSFRESKTGFEAPPGNVATPGFVVGPEVAELKESEPASEMTPDSFPPELIEAIARRAVQMLSERVVREIAWDVVPDLAELMIKRQLEEKESQPK
jgi:CheY-like chemotaxis protein